MNSIQPNIVTSDEDKELLSEKGLEARQISEKIFDIVERAQKIYAETSSHKIVIDEQIQVKLPWSRARGSYKCIFCDYRTPAPGDITIKNMASKAKITFDDHSLHQLKEHLYFGQDQYKIDPLEAARVVSLM